ncbi:DUF4013 domain-containing protein [Methanoplanus endosymbiosus]|uniref:DUF4013 domain-containing protein n=1 Tax=Methanoplanus endosymbiosus TaxID=33865 RepID=A0A9E7TLT1_9EURY|nr:DUF4013 domain-containing protein [Methanoplanus endosymbiosus]UUX92686.1 DUF4013 domain-containing protein [Methanoplanus endosymbiosus]
MSKDIVGEALSYTKDGFVGEWMKWLLLIICTLIQGITFNIVPLATGYMYRIYSGAKPAPEINQWGKLFVDGWKINIVMILYAIPAIIIALIFGVLAFVPEFFAPVTTGQAPNMVALAGVFVGLGITMVVILVLFLFAYMGVVRLGKTDKIGEAFNFHAINETVSNGVGWLGYIGYYILLWLIAVIFVVIMMILAIIPLVGWFLMFVIAPLWAVFTARYMVNIYEAGE